MPKHSLAKYYQDNKERILANFYRDNKEKI